MSWKYLEISEDGELLETSPRLPGPGTAYLGFDIVRNTIVLGYTEHGGYHSFLDPNVNDECNIVAFAPLNEPTDPDIEIIRRLTPWKDVTLDLTDSPVVLLRKEIS